LFNGDTLRDAIISGANNIYNNRIAVDELNVFPVPDGDTGTNMSMSLANAAKELSRLSGEGVDKVSNVAASALLRGARGNSGVILSLLFRGIAKGFKGHSEAGATEVVQTFRLGVEAAYNAVMKPTEGTILTVSRMATEAVEVAVKEGKNEVQVFEIAVDEAKRALELTPEMLPVLKKAGVVDAGGKGVVIILEGMLSVIRDGVIIVSNDVSGEPEENSSASSSIASLDEDINFTYCTEYIVNRSDESKDPKGLRAYLETIGDCVVVVDDETIIKVHVHTDHPGNAIERALGYGQLISLKIENMRDQNERAKHKFEESKKAKNLSVVESYTPAARENPYGFVSISAGDGLNELFKDLGTDRIVGGGQTMNPSTEDILKAIELTPAETVFVLPNNKNIIMAAEQAIPLSTRNVIVLHTRTIPMGIAAMLAFDPDLSAEDNAINMQNAFGRVGTGQITFAARDSNYDGHKIKEGELLALENGKVAFTEKDMVRCAVKLTKGLFKSDSAFVTIIYGEDVTEEQAEEIKEAVAAKLGSHAEITVINGGQPVYYLIISVE